MITFPRAPRLQKGAIVWLDPFSPLGSAIVFEYSPHTLTRTLTAQTAGGQVARAVVGELNR